DGDLTVSYSVAGTASVGDYSETLSGSVVIPDGQASATITITPVDDGDVEGDETVTLTLAAGSGYTVGSPSSDTVTIADNDQSVEPTVVDFETSGDENGFVNLIASPILTRVTGNGGYVLEVAGGNQDTRTAKFSPSGVDFTMAEGTVSADVHLRYFSAFGGVGSYNGLLLKDWTDSQAHYGGYVVVLNANGGNIDVRIGASNIPGAAPAAWYGPAQGHSSVVQQTIATFTDPNDGQTHSLGWWNVEAEMTVVNDTDVQIDVTVTDDQQQTYNVSYTDTGAAAVTGAGVVGVSVNDVFGLHSQVDNFTLIPAGAAQPEATIVANDASAAEAGPDAGQFTVTLDTAAVGDVDVNYTVTGTASSGDYSETLSGVVTVLDGQTTAVINITPVDDSEIENNETVTITLAAGTGYTIGTADSDTVTIVSDDVPGPVFEHGVLSGVDNSDWTTVNLTHTYTSMVVVCTPNYDNTSVPLVVRVRNASGGSFDVMAQRADGLSGTVSGIDVHYFVVEEGVYTDAADGVKMEAVRFTSTVTDEDANWTGQSRSYSNSYTTPVVVGQVMTYNDADWSAFWACGSLRTDPPSSSALTVGKMVGEDSDVTRADETIGYVVVEAGLGTMTGVGFVAGLGGDSILGVADSPPYSYSLSGLPTVETAVASLAGMDGANGGWSLLYGSSPLTTSTLNLAIDEDQIGDSERSHTSEQVAYIVFDPPLGEGLAALEAPAGPARPARPIPPRPVRGIRRMLAWRRGGPAVVLPEVFLPGLKPAEVGPAGADVPAGARLPQRPAGRAVRNVLAELEPLILADLLPLQ
ncbi:MAG TPA: Calx-beta domain-containing protein, partial [Phycisphaerae bacterium]|nr:Calx-beta domain-containing protein [Phycisphaerae bacterium]